MDKEIIERNGFLYFKTKTGGLLRYTPKKEVIKLKGVYCITDLSNNKKYVGSSKDLTSRLKKYITVSKAKGVLRYITDIKNITIDILEYCDEDKTLERELYWIKELNTIYPIGYNKKSPVDNKFFTKECYVKQSCIFKIKEDKEIITPKPKLKETTVYKYNKTKGNILLKYPDRY